MKNTHILFLALLLISVSSLAKNTPIVGEWILTKVEMEGKVEELYTKVNFKDDGYAEMEGRVFGTWEYNKKSKTITIKSEMVKEFSGEWAKSSAGKSDMILNDSKSKLYFTKLDEEKIKQDNQASGLMGVWQIQVDGETAYMNFEAPDNFTKISISEYSSSRGGGKWIYNKDDNTVIFIGIRSLRGKSNVKNLSTTDFTIENKGIVVTGKRIEQNAANREKLGFTSDDISMSHNNEESNITLTEENSSWADMNAKFAYLKNVSKLTYQRSTLITGLNAFATETLTANVSANEEYYETTIDEIFGELSADRFEEGNTLYPLAYADGYDYRVTGEEEVTVPAGSFTCKVIELADYDKKVKLYMINNRPGVYAKIVLVGNDFDEETYEMYELAKIEGDFNPQDNEAVLGNWLLTKVKTPKKAQVTTANFDFINDGRLMVMNAGGTSFFKWSFNKDNKSVVLDFGDNPKSFTISQSADGEMELSNDEGLIYFFLKWTTANNADSPLTGLWMAMNGDYPFSILDIRKDNYFYDIEQRGYLPLEDNYPQLRGQWMYNPGNSTLVFKSSDYESSIMGKHNIIKVDNSTLVLDGRRKYTKIDDIALIKKNNSASGLEGVWKIKKKDGTIKYYEFASPYQLKFGSDKEQLINSGLWIYNPDTHKLFVSLDKDYVPLGGFNKITEKTDATLKFENGVVAEKVE